MALDPTQQVFESLKRSTAPLIVVPRHGGPDGYATALGLQRILGKLQKTAEVVAVDGPLPSVLSFLETGGTVNHKLEQIKKLVIDIDTSKTEVDHLSEEKRDGHLILSIVPKEGFWQENDIRFSTSDYRYDLVICVGATDLEGYAHFYKDHPEFFFRTPIINIDHSTANEHFGQFNVVDVNACSCGEICYDLVKRMEPGLIDKEIATAFLTGMIAKTKSFKTAQVNPRTLQTASELMQKGADRETIVRNLYRTRSVATLRLWGRALARLKHNTQAELVWTMLSRQDFLHAGAEEDDLADVIDELIATSPDAKKVLLLYEDGENNICGVMRVEAPFDAMELTQPFRPAGTRELVHLCFRGKTLVQAEKELLARLIPTKT